MQDGSSAAHLARTVNDILLEARHRAGLSQRDVAALLGVGSTTVAAIEVGREPRHSTLARYLAKLPGLTAARLLPTARSIPPAASPAAWACYRQLFGFEAALVRRAFRVTADGVESTHLEVAGLRPVDGARPSLELLTSLCRAVVEGSNAVVRGLVVSEADVQAGVLRIEDGDWSHELRFPDSYERRGLDYARHGTWSAGDAESVATATATEVLLPTSKLELRVQAEQDAKSARCLAWPWTGSAEHGEEDLARFLFPHGVDLRRRKTGEFILAIQRPPVGMVHGLDLPKEPATATGAGRRRPVSLASALTRARREEGLSQRQLATRAGVSPVTIQEAESGRDARHGTLLRCLENLPSLAPQDLLPVESATDGMSLDDLWSHYCELYGYVADEVAKTASIDADGKARVQITTSGLRSLRGDARDLKIRLGMCRMALQGTPNVLREIETDAVDAKARVVERRSGREVYRFVFPRGSASAGLTCTRRFDPHPLYILTAARAAERTKQAPPYVEGFSLPLAHPARRLRLSVRFPRGYWPARITAHAWPAVLVEGVSAGGVAERLPPGTLKLRRMKKQATVHLSVDRPLVALHYAIAWELP